jgi:NADH-quinone oxidoreductase subunit N
LLAFFLALFLLALIGVPPTGGFTAKFFIFAAAIEAGYYGIAIVGVVATAVALFFYTRIIFYMYMKEPQGSDDTVTPGNATRIALFIAGTGIAILGLYPSPFMRFLEKAIQIYF